MKLFLLQVDLFHLQVQPLHLVYQVIEKWNWIWEFSEINLSPAPHRHQAAIGRHEMTSL